MTLNKAEYQQRKDFILGITINEYIKTVNPVSSGNIARNYTLELSPATIRNILSELEREGFLTHPHTSAGRVPTQEGYRYYVDNLMNEIQLLEDEKTRIRMEYQKDLEDLEEVMDKTSQVISDLTQCTSIVSVDGLDGRIFLRGTNYVVEYPIYQDVNKIRNILTALERKELLLEIIGREIQERTAIYIGDEINCSQIEDCSLAVARYRTQKGPSGRIAILGPTRMNYGKVKSTLDYLTELIETIF